MSKSGLDKVSLVCYKCDKESPVENFTKNCQQPDGYLHICKDCLRPELRAQYYRSRERRIAAMKEYQSTEKGKQVQRDSTQRMSEKYPEKLACREQTKKLINKGELTKLPCEICGYEKVQCHHEDYTKPERVRWLCTEHHKILHRKDSNGV